MAGSAGTERRALSGGASAATRWVWLVLLFAFLAVPAASAAEVLRLTVKGAIGPATAEYLEQGLGEAQAQGAELLVLVLDTPGGLDGAMRTMIQAILASPVPVAVYVSPQGARAASAGTYLLYAAHVAAMAPATNLGAATPVKLGGLPGGGDEGKDGGGAMEHKLVNDAVAYIRSLAELRGRNAEWAEQAVRDAASLDAARALELGVIDVVAGDLGSLLEQLDGRTVKVAGGSVTLHTRGATVRDFAPDWRAQLLALITDPNVAYILLLIGIYGLIFELANPGGLAPGVVGAICLLLALYAFQLLPVNYAGLSLIALGIAFMVAEALVPSFGALGIGGVVAFVVGSVMLLDADVPGFTIAWPLIATLALTSAAFFIVVAGMAARAWRRRVVSGAEELQGSRGEVLEPFVDGCGWIRVHSETWQGVCSRPLRRGDRVRVVARDGLRLTVEPESDDER